MQIPDRLSAFGGRPLNLSPYMEIFPDFGLPTLMPNWQSLSRERLPTLLDPTLPRRSLPRAKISAKTLLVLHAYHLDQIEPIFRDLYLHEFFHDQVITTDSQDKAELIKAAHERAFGGVSQLSVVVLPNVGRDVLPFWRILERFGAGYDYFLKLHLKKSPHWQEFGFLQSSQHSEHEDENVGDHAGAEWTQDLFRCLLPSSRGEHEALVAAMDEFGLGALFPRPHRVVSCIGWGDARNLLIASEILQSFGVDQARLLAPLIFPAGNMFWGRVSTFLPWASFFLEERRYPCEPVPIDGTFLHASERCASYLLASRGMNIGILFRPPSGDQEEISAPGLRLLPVDVTCYAESEMDAKDSAASSVHQLYIRSFLEQKAQASAMRRELQALRTEISSMRKSRLFRFSRLFRP